MGRLAGLASQPPFFYPRWVMRLPCAILALVLLAACGDDLPVFLSVLAPEDTTDTVGPYRVEARVASPNGVYRLLLRVRQQLGSAAFADVPFTPIEEQHDGGTYFAELPGRPAGTVTEYYLQLIDGEGKGGGKIVAYPDGAPETLMVFSILLSS